MQPELLKKVQTAVSRHHNHPCIFQHNGQYFLSLHQIRSDAQREHVFSLIRKLQIGEEIDIARLPAAIRRIFEAETDNSQSLASHVTMSLAIGMGIGLLVMAIGMLFMTIFGTSEISLNGLQTTSILFVTTSVIGWLFTTLLLQLRKKIKQI